MAVGVLAGHCVEATLKAFLAESGCDERKLKRIAHDLEHAWSAAAGNGLRINTDPPDWLKELNYSHCRLRYRYPTTGTSPWIPNPEKFIDSLAFIIDEVRSQLGMSEMHSEPRIRNEEPF